MRLSTPTTTTFGPNLTRLSQALSVVRTVDETMPVQTLAVLLEVAQNERLSVSELAQRTGIHPSSASRNVAALSQWHWLKRPGLQLVVSEPDPMELRRKVVRLSARGRRMIETILCALTSTKEGRDGYSRNEVSHRETS